MRGYELTDRGKVVIAVILVILIFVIPATILAVRAWAGSTPPPEDPRQSAEPSPLPADAPPPESSNGPLPNGSGFNPLDPSTQDPSTRDPSQDSNDDPDLSDPPEDPPPAEPEKVQAELDLAEGTMMFVFSPDEQDALDDQVASMLGEFLTSPHNTLKAKVAVEMPNLSEEDTSILISALSDAFAQHGITQEKLVYMKNQAEPSERSFEVKLFYYLDPNEK